MNKPSYPFVSCLCLTRNRPAYLRRAIQCFISQSYANKELLIVIRDDDHVSKEIIRSAAGSHIRCLELPCVPKKSLGELRNIAILNCRGDYFCQWDDDDWYHNDRLEIQVEALLRHEKSASILVKYLMYDAMHEQAYLSPIGPWASSILCKKDLVNDSISYPPVSLREDSIFLNRLYGVNCLVPVLHPCTYIYVHHGRNTWNAGHFNRLFARSKKLSADTSLLVKDILNGDLDNAQASAALLAPAVLKEMDYFYFPVPSKRTVLRDLFGGAVFLARLSWRSLARHLRLQR